MDGILNINKPLGVTSHDVVGSVRKILKESRVGHTGTLDPLATGVLLLCVGRATRIARYLEAGEKEYRAVMRLGVTTDTLDAGGRVLTTQSYVPPDHLKIIDAARGFIGSILQRPPAYSAVKVGGVPSYKLAREGRAKPLSPRRVTIHDINLTAYEDPYVNFTITCSKGVYIRTLCADIGDALGMGAHLTGLVRTRSGRFGIAHAATLDHLADLAGAGNAERVVTPIDEALAEFPSIPVSEAETVRILHGNRIPCPRPSEDGGLVRLHSPSGRLLALARIVSGVMKPDIVFS